MTLFNELPDNARLWIFPLDSDASIAQQDSLRSGLSEILANWKAHGHPLRGAGEILADRFIAIGADEADVAASGCSIDALFRSIKGLASKSGLSLSSSDYVFYREKNKVVGIPRDRFSQLVSNRLITAETPVFDSSITHIGQFRSGKFELPFSNSWHSKAF